MLPVLRQLRSWRDPFQLQDQAIFGSAAIISGKGVAITGSPDVGNCVPPDAAIGPPDIGSTTVPAGTGLKATGAKAI